MFRVKASFNVGVSYINNGNKYLHSDGSINSVAEYFETPVDAQRILDKFYPKPKHVWRHGDVFKNSAGTHIYLEPSTGRIVVDLKFKDRGGTPAIQLRGADVRFLFNIEEKL